MAFLLIAGTFHLVGKTRSGNPSGFEPDGDSIQFKPDKPKLLDKLDRVGFAYRLTAIGSTQLRLEGIDALELHFEGSHQPVGLADQARDFLTDRCGLNPVAYKLPENIRVVPPVPNDGKAGYILSRSLEVHGRPVAFAFAGQPPEADGSEVYLNAALLRKSLNYKSLASGNSYPLYYDTLFADLRKSFTTAVENARRDKAGIWAADKSSDGVPAATQAGLETGGVVFPKLFRRLTSYLDAHTGGGVAGFLPWLAATKEQVLDLTTNGFTHLDNVLAVNGNKVKMTVRPEQLVFVSAKSDSSTFAPWLAH